jgi:hypothetical protein
MVASAVNVSLHPKCLRCALNYSIRFKVWVSPVLINDLKLIGYHILYTICSVTAAPRGLWLPRPRGLLITHNDAPQSVGILWKCDQLVAETST